MLTFLIITAIFYLFFSSKRKKKEKSKSSYYNKRYSSSYDNESFISAIMLLTAAMMRADGVAKKSELYVVKTFLLANFGENETIKALQILKDYLNRNIFNNEIVNVCGLIRSRTNYRTRIIIFNYLCQVAKADGIVAGSESDLLNLIGRYFGISTNHQQETENNVFFRQETNLYEHYKTLGINEKATNEEIKKAFRDKAKQWHPDKFSIKSEQERKNATIMFQKINNAYTAICEKREIK